MKPLAIVGIIIALLGVAGFVVGGVSFRDEETALQVGDLKVTAEKERSVAIPPLAAGAAVVVGLGLVVISLTRRG